MSRDSIGMGFSGWVGLKQDALRVDLAGICDWSNSTRKQGKGKSPISC